MMMDESRRDDEAKMQDCFGDADHDLKALLKDAFDSVRLPDDVYNRALKTVVSASDGKSTASVLVPSRKIRTKSHSLRFAYGMAACLILALMGFFGVNYVTTPTAYIDLDINPSIELAVNRFDYVVGVEAINEDAQEILEEANVIGKSSTEAVEELMDEIAAAAYAPDDSFLELSIASDDANQASVLESDMDAIMRNCGYSGRCSVVDENVRIEAQNNNMGMGKYLAAQELIALDSDVTIDECSHMSMRQIRDRISLCEEQSEENFDHVNETNQGEGEPQGYGGNGAGNGNGYGKGGNKHGHYGMRHSQ